MRPFYGHGDTGLFNRGTGLSPWWLFIIGGSLLSWPLWTLFCKALPRLQKNYFPSNRAGRWTILAMTSFAVFLWGSGIRVMAYMEGTDRIYGFMGIPLMLLSLYLFRPRSNRSQ